MRGTTAWTLALGVGIPATALALSSVLLRMQSARLRAAFDQDGRRRVPELAVLVEPYGSSSSPLTGAAGSGEEERPAVAIIGDSWLAGLSAGHSRRAPGLLIARGVSTMLGQPVRLRSVAQASAGAEDVLGQVSAVLSDHRMRRSRSGAGEARYAVIAMGTADLIHPLAGTIGLPVLSTVINRLQREGDYRVLVLTAPNLGSLRGLGRPLRDVLRRSSRVLSGSQWLTAVSTGAVPLSLNQTLAGTTRMGLIADGGRYPSPLGYAQLAAAVLRRIATDLELPATVTPTAEPHPPDGLPGAEETPA